MEGERKTFWNLYEDLKNGTINRRGFIHGAQELGVGLPVTLVVLNSTKRESNVEQRNASEQVGKLEPVTPIDIILPPRTSEPQG